MANYTETLCEYLENGGQLPPEFSEIILDENTTFSDLFTNYYFLQEIGNEDESGFFQTLRVYAKAFCPVYSQKLKAEKELLQNMTETRQKSKTVSTLFDSPLNGGTDETNADNITRASAETGNSGGEISVNLLLNISEYKTGVLWDFLKAFSSCFMGVF